MGHDCEDNPMDKKKLTQPLPLAVVSEGFRIVRHSFELITLDICNIGFKTSKM